MWLKGRNNTPKVAEVGTSLADKFLIAEAPAVGKAGRQAPATKLQNFLAEVERDVAPLQLGMFRRAKLASTFKWRLLDNGCEPALVDELTQMLLVRLGTKSIATAEADEDMVVATPTAPNSKDVQGLLSLADACAARDAHAEAAECYQQVLKIKPRHLPARNNLGVALCKLGDYREAEKHFRRAVGIQPTYPDAQFNLGTVLRSIGQIAESEEPLRRAIKLSPKHAEAQASLGLTLIMMGRLDEARECFEKVLRLAPQHAAAMCGLGQIARIEGRFAEAVELYTRCLETDTQLPAALAGLAAVRKMSRSDNIWLKSAENAVASGIPLVEEADLRFSMGKYCDDVGNFEQAFRNYERANELQKNLAAAYDRAARSRFVDDMINVYPRDVFATVTRETSDSTVPVFVTGMMRSGTSLVEQIVASHPQARGAGELSFWNDVARKHEDVVRSRWLDEPLRKKLADSYLRTLERLAPDARRVVDKSTFNTDYLGLIHSVFPNARLIYLQRDPIDTCLSCYFQPFSTAHNFTFDLADLAHYYREHRRLVGHWRAALPAGTLLEVPYAGLVSDQERWSRKILDFVGLEWDQRCLNFHTTERPVLTASFWQVRQKIYRSSLGRWRHYEKFIGPLRELQDLRS
jgi:tetratricopeptide (TPR) repeat protein